MKYIVLETEQDNPQKVPLIFPDFLVHSEMARHLREAIRRHLGVESKAVSAGNIVFEDVVTTGKSETLKLTSRDEDAKMIAMYDYLKGY